LFREEKICHLAQLCISIFLLVRNYAAHTAARVSYVALSAWHQMNMHVKNGLPGVGTSVDADVEA
jgi:hypothetical protein